MAATPDCLTSLLGLSDGTSTCFALPTDPDEAAAVTASATGLYLDEVEGLRLQAATGAPGGPATDLWQRLAKARKLAVEEVRQALEVGKGKSFGTPIYQQRGTLGGLGNGTLMPVGTRAYMPFYTNARLAGAWRIMSLQLFTDVAVTDAPLLLDGVQVAELSTTGASGVTSGLPPEGLLIPLDGNQHTLEVTLPPTVRVRQNNFFAGCFSCQQGNPWFKSVIGTKQPSGIYTGGSLSNVTATTQGNGFSITVREECAIKSDMLCYAIGSDYSDADGPVPRYIGLPKAIGRAIMYKAAELFTIDLLANQQRSRYTMLEPKALDDLVDYYRTKQATIQPDGTGGYLPWLNSPEGLGQVQHPCFLKPVVAGISSQWTL